MTTAPPELSVPLSTHDAQALNLLMEDETITDILINAHDRIFIERDGKMQRAALQFGSADDVWALANAMVEKSGRQKQAQQIPVIDGSLPDGSRFNVTYPPVALHEPSISIRKFPRNLLTFDRMVARKAMTPQLAAFLKAAVREKVNIIVSGATSTGKTTLLSALIAQADPLERLIVIEDTPELQIEHPNTVRLETHSAWRLSAESITARDLVKTSLRMRPDRIIVGESRGAEAFDILQAMNTGHEGSMTTIHANAPRDALTRFENMVNLANLNLAPKALKQQIASAVGLVVQMLRSENGRRYISHVTEVIGVEGEIIVAQDLFVASTDGDPLDVRQQQVSSRSPKHQRAMEEAKQLLATVA